MKTLSKSKEEEIQQLLKESNAENDALKKLIAALKEEEDRKRAEANIPGEICKPETI